jgi:cellulose synthase/poly-beta-1,6-N-acetylglucosamine synthase-like glycosyltransferase
MYPKGLLGEKQKQGPALFMKAFLAMKAFLVLATLLTVQSVISLREGFVFLRYVRRRLGTSPDNYSPSVAVIIPCKRLDPGFDVNVGSFINQDYPRYELIFAVASERDPAWPRLAELINRKSAAKNSANEGAGPNIKLVVAGRSQTRAEKVTNLLRGLEVVSPETEALVFADADARPKPDWLQALVAPLADPTVTVSTGFRWYLPGDTFASRLRAAWDTSVATMLGEHNHNIAWGGSMAIRASEFHRLRIAEDYWANTASDDYAITHAVREAGGRIVFEPRCLVASREESTGAEFLRWANRQIILTRVYATRLWALGLASYALYCSTMVLGMILLILSSSSALERGITAGLLLIILGLGIAKGGIRTVVARELFPEESASVSRYGSCYWRLAPLVPWVMLLNFITAGFTRRIEWQGVHYDLLSATKLRVLRRD